MIYTATLQQEGKFEFDSSINITKAGFRRQGLLTESEGFIKLICS